MKKGLPVGGKPLRVGLGQPLEGVGHEDAPVRNAVGCQGGAHEDAGPSPPHARLDEVPFDAFGQDGFDGRLQLVEPLHPDHRVEHRGARTARCFSGDR